MSDGEERASPEIQEQVPDQPEAQELEVPEQDPPQQVESAEAEADQPPPEATEPELSPEDQPAETEAVGDKEAEEPKQEAAEEKEEEDVEEEEEPVVITPDGNPFWLSSEEVLSKGLPDSEVENFKNFYFKHAYSLQSFHDALKDVMVQTEFVTLSREEIEALTVEGEVSEEQQQVLNGLQDRINAVIDLYEKDGALIKINGRSAKDALLEKSDETFVQTIRDAAINFLEAEKQSCSAYSVWKDQEQHPGAFKRGFNKLRASFRRSHTGSTSAGNKRRPKLEEEKKAEDAPKDEEAPKPAEDGEAAPKEGGETAEGGTEPVTVEVEVEVASGDAAAKEEEPKEEADAAPPSEEPKEEEAAEPASEEPKPAEEPKEEAEAPKEEEGDKKEEEEAKSEDKKEDGEIQAAPEEGKEAEKKEEKSEEKSKHKAAPKKKTAEEWQCKEAKSEPIDNRVLRAFWRVMRSYYRVEDGKAALDQLRSSIQIRNDLNKLKAFGGVEGVQVSLSVSRWQGQLSDQAGMMFRGFVYDNELTALSQYDDTVYFPYVLHYKDTIISGKVQQFFQDNIKETLKDLKNYLIDFFVAPDKVFVLRLSPFYTAMGACLFTWNEDSRVLTKGPFQFRVVSAPKLAPDAYSSYQARWQDMLNSVLQQRKDAQSRPTTSRMGCTIL